jgi:hypothetical protein
MDNMKQEIENLEITLKELRRLHKSIPLGFVPEGLAMAMWRTECELAKEISLLKEQIPLEQKLKGWETYRARKVTVPIDEQIKNSTGMGATSNYHEFQTE